MPVTNYIRRKNVLNSISSPIVDLSMEDAIKEAGLDFEVGITETRVRLENPYHKIDPIQHPHESLLYQVPDSFATYRKDTNYIFGAVGSKYQVVQNSVALDFIEQVCNYDRSVRIETAGCYKNGASMLVTAKFPDSLRLTDDDDIDRYLLFTNSHDGSGAIKCAVTNIRVICNNMLNQALNNSTQQFSFKHTRNVQESIMMAVEEIRHTYAYSEVMREELEALRSIKIADANVKGYVYKLFLNSEQQAYMKVTPNIYSADTEIISTKLKNKIGSVLDVIEKGVGQEKHRGTLLWLYNGVSCYINNVANYNSETDRFISLTQGGSYRLNQRAYDLAKSAIKAA